jgi:short-subunit dehydrogenase
MNSKGKVIAVTGGGNGIGRELVLNLLKNGSKIAAIDLNLTSLEETKSLAGEDGKNLSLHVLDIRNKSEVELLPEKIIEKHGSIDGLINNAGIIQPFIKINDLDYNTIEKLCNVNFYGTLYMIKTFLPYLLDRPEAHIVNISSMGGFLPVPGQGIYGATKAAAKLFTEALYAELFDTNVRVTLVFPGAIATNISSNSGVKITKKMESMQKESNLKPMPPSKAAEIIVKGMEKNRYRIFVGNDSRLMDLLYRLNPKMAIKFIAKQMAILLNQ